MNTITHSQPNVRIVLPCLQLPAIQGNIERRILVNYRCDEDVIAKLLPEPFRPKLVQGFAIAGICLIRLTQVRPAFVPKGIGIASENAAHRIAVEWDDEGEVREGVFIPRRDSNSALNRLAGGRLFPAIANKASFNVAESDGRFKVELHSADGATHVRVAARVCKQVEAGSVFATIAEASNFFRAGCVGWSARANPDEFDGVELCTERWNMEPLAVERVESSFFSDVRVFPPGAATFDSAFLMRNIPHRWIARGRMITHGGEMP